MHAQQSASLVQSIGRIGGKVVTGTTKSGHGRSVALDAAMVEVLEAHRLVQDEHRALMGVGYTQLDLVFAKPDGTALYPEGVLRSFQSESAAAGLPVIRLHDLRHTWASLALVAGVHPKVVQERLGHSSITITLGTYSHVARGMHDDAAEQIAALVRNAKAPAVRRALRAV